MSLTLFIADGSSPVTYTQIMQVMLRLEFLFFFNLEGVTLIEKNSSTCFVYSAQLRCCPCSFFSRQVARTNTTNFIQLGAGYRFLPSLTQRPTHPEAKDLGQLKI